MEEWPGFGPSLLDPVCIGRPFHKGMHGVCVRWTGDHRTGPRLTYVSITAYIHSLGTRLIAVNKKITCEKVGGI